ncbi:hypothetical protein [Escherichia coli]|nr:hypothetical protein [Escherichia coli]
MTRLTERMRVSLSASRIPILKAAPATDFSADSAMFTVATA